MQEEWGPRTLVVMRHARAEASGATDHDRRLSEQGLAQAADAGRWLAQHGVHPDHALVSAAVRTRETWDVVATEAGWDLEPDFDDGLYAAGPETALDLLRRVPDTVRALVVIGHNPAVASLAQLLDDGEGDEEAGNELALGYPPAALTVLTHDGDWKDLDEASARVVAFRSGRG